MNWVDGLRIAPAVARARFLGGAPYKLLLSLTDRCNHRCRHCFAWQRRPADELRPAELARVLRSLPGLRWLELTGGEPTLRPDLDEVVAALAPIVPRLVFLHFATNGSLPQRAVALADGLARAGGPRPVVTVSLDGDEALHDRIRGRSGAFASALETARALLALGSCDVYVGTTVTPDNLDHLDTLQARLQAELPALLPARWHVNLMDRSAHFFGNAHVPLPERTASLSVAERVQRLRGRPTSAFGLVEWVFWRNLRWYLAHERAPVPCQAGRASVHLGATGDVYACHILDQGLGNVRAFDLDLARLLGSPAVREAQRRLDREGCAGCWSACEAWHALAAAPVLSVVRALARDVRP